MAYSDEILADSPEVYWRFGESSGSTANDSSGNGRAGSYEGDPTLGVSGAISGDTAVSLDGSGDYISTSYTGVVGTAARTWEIWFKSSGAGDYAIMGNGRETSSSGSDIRISLEGGVIWLRVLGGATSWGSGYNDGEWHHLAVTIPDSATLADVRCFVDGVDLGLGSGTMAINTDTNATFLVAQDPFTGSGSKSDFLGEMDEFAHYSTALSSTRIQAHYDAASAAASATLDLPAASSQFDTNELIHCRVAVTPEGKTTSGVQMWYDDGSGYTSWFALRDDGAFPDDNSGDDVWNGRDAFGTVDAVDATIDVYGWSLTSEDEDITFRHLGNMLSGYALPEGPGVAWGYNDYAVNLYAKTLRRIFAGTTSPLSTDLDTAAQSRLVTPLELEDTSTIFTARSNLGVSLSPRDFARIGLLWMREGDWGGSQLIPQSWFTIFTSKVGVPGDTPRTAGGTNDYLSVGTFGGGTDQAAVGPGHYGLGLWLNTEVAQTGFIAWPGVPTDVYVADGHFGGEVVAVYPSLGIVAAARGSWGDSTQVGQNAGTFRNRLQLLSDASTGTGPADATPGVSWNSITDSTADLTTADLDTFVSQVAGTGVITRNGHLVRSWGTGTAADWASAAKPVLSTMLAFAIDEGLIP